ncbi:MAG: HAMP domain-containing histidine kinase [Anaerococcus sp.]|uniref:sensor histidine kinase n=1 Tax=Anaerococcus sp. TaxID=1872515 RepID=UPI00263834C6|nr:HAMP domain-containing sensor histidine kinase [Anaerococcus sp.]MCI5972887.1 HAMP domain-containing histidine kinase [Anaerococcus sp.]
MFNYILKRFKKIVIRIISLMFFLVFIFMTFLYFNYKLRDEYSNPNDVYAFVEENKTDTYLNRKNKEFLKENNIWSIRLDKNGHVIESFDKPREVKDKFELTDVARFTRYYLADYPVFTYITGDGLILFAYPKNSLDKLPANYYNYKNLIFNVEMFLVFVILFLLFVYIFYRIDIKNILQNIFPLQQAMDDIYEEDYEKLDEGGELKDLAISINQANEKFINLKKSQTKWIRGLSHDVRTPLAKISWEISKENKADIDIENIQDQVVKISNILEGLNLTMSLTNMDKESFSEQSPLKEIRKVIVDKLNDNPDREIIFENKLVNRDLKIKMDPNLFYRMLENIIKNSLQYTKGKILLTISNSVNNLNIEIIDEGDGISGEIIEKINKEDLTNVTKHGLGILISKQIAELHGGNFDIKNEDSGLRVTFTFDNIKE